MGKVLMGEVLMDEVLMGDVLKGQAWENKCKPRFTLLPFQQHWGRASVSPVDCPKVSGPDMM